MMRLAVAGVLAVTLAGCGSAANRIGAEALGVSARDAHSEARSVARVWSSNARLRWVEGTGIDAGGIAIPGQGVWRFHYTANDQSQELVVQIQALESASEERAPTSPPGIVIGDNALGGSWIDSREAMDAVRTADTGATAGSYSMLLVPTRPEQWIVRVADASDRWHVHAGTAEVLQP